MFKILTAVLLLAGSFQVFAFDSNANLVANLVRTELWYNGINLNEEEANSMNSRPVELSEELEVALDKFSR